MSAADPSSPPVQPEDAAEQEQAVTPLELFFDLVFVFSFTQVTAFLAHDLTWPGVLRGAAILAILWWAWVGYSWLTDAVPAEDVLPARLVILAAMAAMLVVVLAVPGAFEETAILFGVAYVVVRTLHVVLYAVATPPDTRSAVLRVTPGFLGGPALLLVAGFTDGLLQGALWVLAIAIDFGVGAEGLALSLAVLLAALFGITFVIALWWLYFDYIVLAAERRLASVTDDYERTVLARDSYSFIHLSMVGGIIFIALGIEQTIAHVNDALALIPAVALFGGGALYLLGHNAFRYRDHRTVSVLRLVVSLVSLALILVALQIPAFVALAALTVLFCGLAAYETLWSAHRRELRASRQAVE
ncbi:MULTISPECIES: low temperature requirement protein A [unclassified Haladaptatus]|uniref:low temperature requirement protein A n=1 Tax=unclassified Haladaptatus TaxID=2622732 RepID=UPI0023E84DF4|nr:MULTISPECIES: low temperature requirement protein A [unclassified Haladaptatus]